MSLRWATLSVVGFQNLGRKLRNRKRLREDAKKWFKSWSRCCAVRNLSSSVWFVYCKGGGEVNCFQAGFTPAEGEGCRKGLGNLLEKFGTTMGA